MDFVRSEKTGGLLLIGCTALSLLFANLAFGDSYRHFWHLYIDAGIPGLHLSLEHWINDGLMAIFFLLAGLEIERELYRGELSDPKNALVPVLAAIGGMLLPAAIHFGFNRGTDAASGFGIPMATDIAFALGVLSLLGNRIPVQVKIFLTACAIIDDLGAVLVIALFYTSDFALTQLLISLGIFGILLLCNVAKIRFLPLYIIGGILMWYFMLQSGVHATISGVLLAFAIPFRGEEHHCPSLRVQHALHKPVAFFILPLFALANTAILLSPESMRALGGQNALGILTGLILGKPLGILLFVWLGIQCRWIKLPEGLQYKHILAIGIIAGIGFTMSIFISNLAFADQGMTDASKTAVMLASCIAGIAGYFLMGSLFRKKDAH